MARALSHQLSGSGTAAGLGPLTGPPSAGAIHQAIRDDIILLQLMPGQRLSENELARRFGTSRTPVREAVMRLADEGLVEVWPQRGTFISRISLRAVRRARFVRMALEIAIFRRAAERGLSKQIWAELDETLSEQEGALDLPVQFTNADDRLHRTVANGVEVGDVWEVLEREKVQFDRMRFLSLPHVTPVRLLIQQHRDMLDAVRAGDADAAEKAVRIHLSEGEKVVDELQKRHPDFILQDG